MPAPIPTTRRTHTHGAEHSGLRQCWAPATVIAVYVPNIELYCLLSSPLDENKTNYIALTGWTKALADLLQSAENSNHPF